MADIVEDRVHRIGDQLGALIAEPLGRQHHRFARMLGFEPVNDLRGDKVPRTVALNQGDQAVDHRVQQHLMTVVFGHALQHRRAGLRKIDLIDGLVYGAFQ